MSGVIHPVSEQEERQGNLTRSLPALCAYSSEKVSYSLKKSFVYNVHLLFLWTSNSDKFSNQLHQQGVYGDVTPEELTRC